MSFKGHKWTNAQKLKFHATMAMKKAKRIQRLANIGRKVLVENGGGGKVHHQAEPAPDVIFVMLNGRLQRFQLRNVTIYVPAEELKS